MPRVVPRRTTGLVTPPRQASLTPKINAGCPRFVVYAGQMHGDPEIIEKLNEVLTAELTAINQYFLHGKMQSNWGYRKLGEHSREESIDEMKHADAITDRILYFDGVPNYQRLSPLRIGETVLEQFQADLALEYEAVKRLNEGVALAAAKHDNGTRHLFEEILVHEEEHIDYLETQLELINKLGEPLYLSKTIATPPTNG